MTRDLIFQPSKNHHPATNCQIIMSGEQPRILNSTQLNSYCSQSSTECTLRTLKPKVCTLHTVLTNINVHLLLCIEHICHFTKARTFRFLVDFSRLEAFAPLDSIGILTCVQNFTSKVGLGSFEWRFTIQLNRPADRIQPRSNQLVQHNYWSNTNFHPAADRDSKY